MVCGIKAEIAEPDAARPDEGFISKSCFMIKEILADTQSRISIYQHFVHLNSSRGHRSKKHRFTRISYTTSSYRTSSRFLGDVADDKISNSTSLITMYMSTKGGMGIIH